MTADDPQSVGFLGLGAMGLPMANRIAKAGFALIAVDISEAQVLLATKLGITASADKNDLDGCEVIIVMVATPAQLMDCASIAGLDEGVTAVVMSTVGPAAVKEFAKVVAQRGVRVVDSPVSGGVVGAESGSLSLRRPNESSFLFWRRWGRSLSVGMSLVWGRQQRLSINIWQLRTSLSPQRRSAWPSQWGWTGRRCSSECRREPDRRGCCAIEAHGC